MAIGPSETNGLRVKSQVMADKPVTIRRERIGQHDRLAGRDVAVRKSVIDCGGAGSARYQCIHIFLHSLLVFI